MTETPLKDIIKLTCLMRTIKIKISITLSLDNR